MPHCQVAARTRSQPVASAQTGRSPTHRRRGVHRVVLAVAGIKPAEQLRQSRQPCSPAPDSTGQCRLECPGPECARYISHCNLTSAEQRGTSIGGKNAWPLSIRRSSTDRLPNVFLAIIENPPSRPYFHHGRRRYQRQCCPCRRLPTFDPVGAASIRYRLRAFLRFLVGVISQQYVGN